MASAVHLTFAEYQIRDRLYCCYNGDYDDDDCLMGKHLPFRFRPPTAITTIFFLWRCTSFFLHFYPNYTIICYGKKTHLRMEFRVIERRDRLFSNLSFHVWAIIFCIPRINRSSSLIFITHQHRLSSPIEILHGVNPQQ